MVYRRRSLRKRVSRRPARRTRINKRVSGKVFNCTRMMALTALAGNAGYAPYLAANAFQLDDLPNYTEFTSLFGYYRINAVKVTVSQRIDIGGLLGTAAKYPRFYHANDYDDASAPATLNALRELQGCKELVLGSGKQYSFWVKPAVQVPVYTTGLGAFGYLPKWKQWISTNNPDTTLYGFKWGLDDFTNTGLSFNIEYRFYMSFKGTK